MPMNRSYVGREYPPVTFEITRELTAGFADAIRDPSAAYRSEASVAPPTLSTIPQIAEAMKIAEDPDLHLAWSSVLHGDQEFEWIAPLIAGETYTSTTKIVDIRGRFPLEFIALETKISDADGYVHVRARSTLIAREDPA